MWLLGVVIRTSANAGLRIHLPTDAFSGAGGGGVTLLCSLHKVVAPPARFRSEI